MKEHSSPEKMKQAYEEFERGLAEGKDVAAIAKEYAKVDFYGNKLDIQEPQKVQNVTNIIDTINLDQGSGN